MNQGRIRIVSTIASVALVAAFLWVFFLAREPHYNGQPLSYWFDRVEECKRLDIEIDEETHRALEKAFRHETNRFSKAIQSEDSRLRLFVRTLLRKQNVLNVEIRTAQERWQDAVVRLIRFGDAAVPVLTNLYIYNNPWSAPRVTRTLQAVGIPAIPALKATLTHTNPIVRSFAVNGLVRIHATYRGDRFPSNEVASAVAPLIMQEDVSTRRIAALSLRIMRLSPETSIPALLKALQDSDPIVRREAALRSGTAHYRYRVW